MNTAIASRTGLSILVVDDEPMVGAAISRLLRRHHAVQVVTSAREALLRCAEPESIDVILCDMMMPGMSGAEFFREIVKVSPELAQRIVFVTGGSFTPEARDFLARSANPRVDKPFDQQGLLAAIEKCWALHRPSDRPTEPVQSETA